MKICNKCGKQYSDEMAFCGTCGLPLANLVEGRVCPSCHRNFGDQQVSFCPYCGVNLVTQPVNSTAATPINTNNNYHSVPITPVKTATNTENNSSFFSHDYLFKPDGRRGRLNYLFVNMFLGFVYGALEKITSYIFRSSDTALLVVLLVLTVAYAYPLYCNLAKRFHDLDKPSSWAAVFVIVSILANIINPVYGIFVGLVLNIYPQFFKGTEGPNQYGEEPA